MYMMMKGGFGSLVLTTPCLNDPESVAAAMAGQGDASKVEEEIPMSERKQEHFGNIGHNHNPYQQMQTMQKSV